MIELRKTEGTMLKKQENSNIKKNNMKILDMVLVGLISISACTSLILNYLSFIYVRNISQGIDMIKNDVWRIKTNAYDTGSLSFFNGQIEAAKKDINDNNIVKGELINRANKRIEYAEITFKVYDQDGNLIDTSMDSIKAWDSGEKWIYKATIDSSNSSKYEFAELSIMF
jgi:hypothetical protein